MTFESYALYPHMSVFDNMALPLRSNVHRRPEAEIKQRVQDVADVLGIGMLLDRMPGQLSQGQKQRVGLGRTLVREPSVFLFDEPLSHVDAKVRHRMRMELKRIQEELKTTSLYVTHDYLEAMSLGDRIVVIKEGEIQQVGPPREIFHRPVNEFVAEIVGDPRANILDATVTSRDGEMVFELEGAGCDLPVLGDIRQKLVDWPGNKVRVGVRPMYVTPYLSEQPVCQIGGSVYVFERIETKGVLTTKVGDVMILAETEPDFVSRPNQPVWLSVDLSRIRVYDPATGMAIAP
jgi:multiple sugar transport system ATP-binding protein